jgi:hypothetical protein
VVTEVCVSLAINLLIVFATGLPVKRVTVVALVHNFGFEELLLVLNLRRGCEGIANCRWKSAGFLTACLLLAFPNYFIAVGADAVKVFKLILALTNTTGFGPAVVDVATDLLFRLFIHSLLVATITIALVILELVDTLSMRSACVFGAIVDVHALPLARDLCEVGIAFA